MSYTTDKIKEMARDIQAAEELNKLIDFGSVERIDDSRSSRFEIKKEFMIGSGIKGSINERMFVAQKRGIEMLNAELKSEAEKIVFEILGLSPVQQGAK